MANRTKKVRIICSGKIVEILCQKGPAPRSRGTLTMRIAADVAGFDHVPKLWASKFGGEWCVHFGRDMLRVFPNVESCDMWMLHREGRT